MPRHTESRPGRLLQKGKEKAVPSDDKSTAHVETLNTLLNQIHVPIRLAALQDVVPSLWVALFEGLFQTRIPSIVRDSQTQSAKINNVKEVLKALGEAVGTELSHIQAEEVVAGGWGVADLVEVFGEVGRVLREDGPPAPRRTDESGWTEVSGDEADEQQPELDEKSRLPHHRPHGKSRSAAYPKTSTPLPLSPPKESHRSPSPHPSKASAIHLRGSPSRKENKTERPKRRRLRSGGETGILTDVKDDVEEYLQENMFAENKSSDGGWIDEIDEDVQTDRTPRAVKRHDNDQNRVPKASPTRKRQPQTPAVLKIHATDTPYTRALKRRRARIIREAQTPSPVKARGVSKIPNRGFIVRDRAPSPEQSGGPSHRQASPTRSANHKASEHSSEEGDTPQPITNLRTFESMIRTALPGAPLPAGARARAWDQQLKVHDRALKDRVWDRRSQRPRTTVEQEVKPLITGARRLAEDIALRHKKKEVQALQTATSKLKAQRHRVVRMKKLTMEAQQFAKRQTQKSELEDERITRNLLANYTRQQRTTLLHDRRLEREARKKVEEEVQRVQAAKDTFFRTQLELLQEQLADARREEEVVVKAHTEELRKLVRDQKLSAAHGIKQVKGKVGVDVRNKRIFREEDARRVEEDLAWVVRTR